MRFVRRENGRRLREKGYTKQYYENHKERFKEYSENHKNHDITKLQWEHCKNYFDNCCAYCGLSLDKHWIKFNGETRLGDFHKDHLYNDDNNQINNCVPACKKCNSMKWVFDFEEWYKKQEFYTDERYNKILKWINEDSFKYMNS
jgi:hypothetical protein